MWEWIKTCLCRQLIGNAGQGKLGIEKSWEHKTKVWHITNGGLPDPLPAGIGERSILFQIILGVTFFLPAQSSLPRLNSLPVVIRVSKAHFLHNKMLQIITPRAN